MKREKIAIDICNTIADVNKEIDKITGVKRPRGIYYHPAIDNDWFKSHLDLFHNCNIIKGSVEGVQLLAKYYDIVYLTARPIEAFYYTKQWLEDNGFPKGILLFSQNKSLCANKLGIKLAFEDCPKEIDSYMAAGIDVYVKKQDYNLQYSNRFQWDDIA